MQKKKNEDYAEVQLIECNFQDEKYNKEELNFRKEPCMPKMINNICDYIPRSELITSLIQQYQKEELYFSSKILRDPNTFENPVT